MRREFNISYFVASIMLLNFVGCKNVSAQEDFSEKQVVTMLKDFYTSYISEYSKIPEDKKKLDSIKAKYWTPKLSNYVGKLFREQRIDNDPFLKSQMIDILILKTISFSKDLKQNNIYYGFYIWPGEKNSIVIKLLIAKEKEAYKIDHVFIEGIDE